MSRGENRRPQASRARKALPVLAPALLWLGCLGAFDSFDAFDAASPNAREPVPATFSRDRESVAPMAGIQLGPRPFYLLDRLAPGPLRDRLDACRDGPFAPTRFSIGHRGAPLQFPEHTRESYVAAARMGAGTLECDVTFTRDHALVCRHSQCDLATTTNILATPLAERCSAFEPATFDPATGRLLRAARRRCCTSDLDLAEFRTLEGRMDAWSPFATREAEFLTPTAGFRPALYDNGGTLMTHAESIVLFRELGVAMTPELKQPEVASPRDGGFTREVRARALIEAYQEAGTPPEEVFPQSFDADVIRLWLREFPAFGARAIWLDGRAPAEPIPEGEFARLYAEGFRTVAPPIASLLRLDGAGEIVATEYVRRARAAGLEIVTWTIERSGRIRAGRVEGRAGDYYLDPILEALETDGDVYRVIDALYREVGVRAIFSDWPATVTYYANCLGIE